MKRQLAGAAADSESAGLAAMTASAEDADSRDESATDSPTTTCVPLVSGLMSVELTRTELVALKETIEVTPVFEGRSRCGTRIHEVLYQRRHHQPLCIEESILTALAQRIIAVDVPTAALRSKLSRALQDESLRSHA